MNVRFEIKFYTVIEKYQFTSENKRTLGAP
jgi:hypothetical protein